jgi:DNA-binding HxlR family transcriptional regulator
LIGKLAVNGSGNGAHSGAQTLALLATPLNPRLLKALADGPKPQVELRRDASSPAQTTLRAQLKRLHEAGAIEKNRLNGFPGVLEYELSPAGRGLLQVAKTIDYWLARAPEEPAPAGESAKAAIKALTDAWSATMLRVLATSPASLTELDRVIGSLSYPSLERRLVALRLAGQVEATATAEHGTPQALTRWAREGAGPIAAAARWERRHMSGTAAPFGRVDAETMFLLTIPLLRLEERVSGSCRLAMEIPRARGARLAGIVVQVHKGQVESCTSRLTGDTDAWGLGSPVAWLEALVAADTDRIESGGDGRLALALLRSMHRALFARVPQ